MDSLTVQVLGHQRLEPSVLETRLNEAMERKINLDYYSEAGQAIGALEDNDYGVVVLNKTISQQAGLDFLQSCQNWERFIPVLMLTDTIRPDSFSTSLRYGADVQLPAHKANSPMLGRSINQALGKAELHGETELKRLEFVTFNQQKLDSLTGIKNKAGLKQCIKRRITDFEPLEKGLHLLVLGIENFRRIQEELDFQRMNTILKRISQILSRNLGHDHLPARVGDREFSVLFSGLNYEAVLKKHASLARTIDYSVNDFLRKQGLDAGIDLESELTSYRNYISDPDEFMTTARQNYEGSNHSARQEPRGDVNVPGNQSDLRSTSIP